MKKVSVFTVLTCFLAGGVTLPCYAGPAVSKIKALFEDESDPEGQNSPPPVHPPSQPGGQGLDQGDVPSAHPKPNPSPSPSPSPFDPVVIDSGGLNPDLLSKTPATFDPPSDSKDQHPETDPKMVQQIADSVREALGENAQNVTVHVYLPPSVPPTPISLPEKVLEDSHEIPSSDKSYLPTQVSSQIPSMHPISYPPVQGSSQIPSMQPTPYPPHGDQQTTLPILSSSKDHEDVIQVTRPADGWALILPMTLKPIQIPNSRGQLVRLPKVLDLCIYPTLSDVNHTDFKIINSQSPLQDSNISDGFNLINAYLNNYGKRFGQDVTAIANSLRQAVETSKGRPVSFKVCQRKDIRTALFMFHVEGGAVIIGKIPGQDL